MDGRSSEAGCLEKINERDGAWCWMFFCKRASKRIGMGDDVVQAPGSSVRKAVRRWESASLQRTAARPSWAAALQDSHPLQTPAAPCFLPFLPCEREQRWLTVHRTYDGNSARRRTKSPVGRGRRGRSSSRPWTQNCRDG